MKLVFHRVVALLLLALVQSALGSVLWRRNPKPVVVSQGSGLFARAGVETAKHGLLAPGRPIRRSELRTHPPTFNATQCQSVFHSHSGSTLLFPNADIFREEAGRRRCGALVTWRNVHDVKFKLQWMQVEGQLGNHSTLGDVRVRGGFSLNNQQMIPLSLIGSPDQGLDDEVGFGQRFNKYMLVGQDDSLVANDAPDATATAATNDLRNSPCVRNESDVLSLFLELDIQWSYNATLGDGKGFGGFKARRHEHHHGGDGYHGTELDDDDDTTDDQSISPLTIRFGGSALTCDGGEPAFEFKTPPPDIDLDDDDDSLNDVPSSVPTDSTTATSSSEETTATATTSTADSTSVTSLGAAATTTTATASIANTSSPLPIDVVSSSITGLKVPVSSWVTLSATNSSTTSSAPTTTMSSSSSKLQ